ncbi:MAG: helix-turn-helix transcriptional regulator [Cyanobacteria bacterium P01_A01_bin.68]
MPVRNLIKQFVDGMGISPYKFQKDTGLAQKTAYDLYNDAWQAPHITSLNKICDYYRIQPGKILEWVPPEEEEDNQNPEEKV